MTEEDERIASRAKRPKQEIGEKGQLAERNGANAAHLNRCALMQNSPQEKLFHSRDNKINRPNCYVRASQSSRQSPFISSP